MMLRPPRSPQSRSSAASDVYKRRGSVWASKSDNTVRFAYDQAPESVDPYFNNVRIGVIIGANVWDTLVYRDSITNEYKGLSLIHISEPTRLLSISYADSCLKKKNSMTSSTPQKNTITS